MSPLDYRIPLMAGQDVPKVATPMSLLKDTMGVNLQQAQIDQYAAATQDRVKKAAEEAGLAAIFKGAKDPEDALSQVQRTYPHLWGPMREDADKHYASVWTEQTKKDAHQVAIAKFIGDSADAVNDAASYAVFERVTRGMLPAGVTLPVWGEDAKKAVGYLSGFGKDAMARFKLAEGRHQGYLNQREERTGILGEFSAAENQADWDAAHQMADQMGVGPEYRSRMGKFFDVGSKARAMQQWEQARTPPPVNRIVNYSHIMVTTDAHPEPFAAVFNPELGRIEELGTKVPIPHAKIANNETAANWQYDKMLVPNGKGGFETKEVRRNPRAPFEIVDVQTNQDVSKVAKPIPTAGAPDDAAIQEAAKNLVENPNDLTRMSAITTLRGDQRIKLYNEIKKLDPTFDVGLIDHRVKFLGQYEDPKGRAAINRKSLNNIIMHTADLLTASAKYVRSDTRLFNTPINMLARQGSQQWQAYQTPFAVLAGEIELYFTGGYAPQGHDKARWDNVVNGTSTPKQIEQFARDIIHVALRRADSDNSQFNTNMGYDDPNMISPSAMAAAEFVSEDIAKEAKKLGSGGSIGRGNRAKSPGRFVGVYPGGEEAFDTQAQLDEFIAKAKAQGVVVTVKTSAAPESPGKADYLWDPVSKTLKKVGG